MALWQELRRRNVFKVCAAYGIVAWLIAQIVSVMFPPLGLPSWTVTFVIALLIVGLPVALILAWAYELTPEGIKKTRQVPLEQSITRLTGQRLTHIIIVLLLLAVASFLFRSFLRGPAETTNFEAAPTRAVTSDAAVAPSVDRRSIAVLPFANLSRADEDELFVEGIHDDILSQIARIGSLKVISRTSVMGYRDTSKNVRTIGDELGVAAILEGGVQRAGDSVRINIQLIDARADENIWAATFNRELNPQNIFSIQTEIAVAVAEQLQATLTPEEVSRFSLVPTRSPRAYDAYVRGRYFWNQRTEEGFERALTYFNQAIEEDPSYPLAYAGVASVYNLIGHELFALDDPNNSYPRAIAAARSALERDDSLGEAHAVLGDALFRYEWDLAAAQREHERAIALNPNYVNARIWYSHYLLPMGHREEALQQSLKALELDPLNLIANLHLGWYYFYVGENELAIEQLRKNLELNPDFVLAHLFLGQVYEEQSRYEEAIEELNKAVDLSGRVSVHVAALAHAYGASGRTEQAERLLRELLSSQASVPSYEIAVVYAGLQRRDDALTSLERAYEAKDSSWLVDMALDPRFRELRAASRFRELERRLGLPMEN